MTVVINSHREKNMTIREKNSLRGTFNAAVAQVRSSESNLAEKKAALQTIERMKWINKLVRDRMSKQGPR